MSIPGVSSCSQSGLVDICHRFDQFLKDFYHKVDVRRSLGGGEMCVCGVEGWRGGNFWQLRAGVCMEPEEVGGWVEEDGVGERTRSSTHQIGRAHV